MKRIDYMRSQDGRIELVNVELTEKRLLCGCAFIEAWAEEFATFRDDRQVEICSIVVPQHFQNQPTAIAASSPNDDIFFAIKQ